MKRMASLVTIALLGALPMQSIAQGPPQEFVTPSGNVITPPTSVENKGDHGQRGHTNHLIVVPQKGPSRSSTPAGETPGSLACLYGITSAGSNCPITGKITSGNNGLPPPSGGSGIIALVGAYDYPTAEHDLNVFSDQFGLPPCTTENGCFKKFTRPPPNRQRIAAGLRKRHLISNGLTPWRLTLRSFSLRPPRIVLRTYSSQ